MKKEEGVGLAAENTIVAELERLLAYHNLLGINHYPSRDDLTDFLAFEVDAQALCQDTTLARQSDAPRVEKTRILQETRAPKVASTPPVSEPVAQVSSSTKVEDVCSNCELRSQQKAFIPGKGSSKARLLVVGGWLINSSQIDNGKSTFGVEEDLMLARMFSAMKLAPNDVFVTNLVKCCLEKGVRPSEDDIEACQRLLQQQIIDLQPEIICAMGSLAARTLLQKERSLSQLRGKFFQTEVVQGLTLPVFATYHPSYLVHNEEMKVPTWEDLQKIARRLATKKAK